MLFNGISNGQEYSYLQYTTKDGLAGLTVHGISQDNSGFLWLATDAGLSRFDGKQFHNFTVADGLPSNEIFFTFCDSENKLWISCFKNALCYYYKGKIYNQHNDAFLKTLKTPSHLRGMAETEDGRLLIIFQEGTYVLSGGERKNTIFVPRVQYANSILQSLQLARMQGDFPNIFLPPAIRTFARDTISYHASRKTGLSYTYMLCNDRAMILTASDTTKSTYIPYPNLLLKKFYNDSIVVMSSTLAGIQFYDFKNRRFIRDYLPRTRVQDFFEDSEGNFWFSTKGTGLFRLGRAPFVHYAFGPPERPFAAYQIFLRNKQIYVVTEAGRYWRFPQSRKSVAGEPLPLIKPSETAAGIDKLKLQPNTMLHFYDAHISDIVYPVPAPLGLVKTAFYYQDTVLLACFDAVYRFDIKGQRMLDTIFSKRATCATKLQNTIYIGALDGLYTFRDDSLHYLGRESPLLSNRISTIVNGDDGILWIGTYEGGVAGICNGKVQVSLNKKNCGLSSDVCQCLFPDGNFLWVGTEKGINKIDIKAAKPKVVARYDMADGLRSDNIKSLFVDGDIVYAGTQDGITCFDQSRVPLHGPCNILFTRIVVGGQTVDPESGEDLSITHARNHIRFEYAGLSFASAGNIVYRYRLQGLSEEWFSTDQTFLDYPALPSGAYILQIKAINKFGDASKILEKRFTIEPLLWERRGVQALAAGILVAVTGLLFQLRFRSVRKKDQEQQLLQRKMATLEQKALRAQMNPHFIFNCLNSIQHFVITNDVRGANFYLSRFASLVRSTLEHAALMYIRLSAEIDYLTSYLELEQMQSPSAFQYSIHIDPRIDIHQVSVPSMLLQPFLENAIKHGVSRLPSGGLITLELRKNPDEKTMTCTITDNGPGIHNLARKNTQGHIPRGTSITQERIEILNQVLESGRIEVQTRNAFNDNTGTSVILILPILNYSEEWKQTQTL